MWFTILRQVAGALAAWLVQWAARRDVQLDEGTIIALMTLAFGLVAQSLKHFTVKRGEIQPGGVSHETTEAEKAKAGV